MEHNFAIPAAPTPQSVSQQQNNGQQQVGLFCRSFCERIGSYKPLRFIFLQRRSSLNSGRSHLPLNVLAQQQQNSGMAPQPYNTLAQPYQQPYDGHYAAPPPNDPYNPYNAAPYQQVQPQYQQPNPFQGGNMYGQPGMDNLGDFQNQINDPFFSAPPPQIIH